MAAAPLSTKERLLEVASRLFYAEGIHTVGIDRVVAEAGVAKTTLYAHFPSKDDLVAAYLARHSMGWAAAVEKRLAATPPALTLRALAPFDVLAERAAAPGYRGCPFINAAAEFPAGPVADQIAAHRQRVRQTFSNLTAPIREDSKLLNIIVALYDGAMSAAYLDHDPAVVAHARRAAEELLRLHSRP